ncbi:MAG: hypothetical protein IJM49_01200 [Firmicutes bacterium]|nr:hypothetical protein [Bacillota bacterium]MBR0482290.1 hypothetical protein [Bacillota bacterium]
MQYFIDHYLVGVIFMIIAIYSGYQIWNIKKQKKENEEAQIPAPVIEDNAKEPGREE